MGRFFLIVFLLLFALLALVETKIPHWVLGVSALVAGIALAYDWFKKSP